MTTSHYAPCLDCGAAVDLEECPPAEGPFGEFGEPGWGVRCPVCWGERQEEEGD